MKSTIYKIITFVALLPVAASADTYGLETAADETTLIQDTTVPKMVAIIINGLLSLLGMLFTVLIVWGGFRWMTSQGNTQQVDEARNIIKNAAIGLIIVVMAYAIARFVLDSLAKETGGGGGDFEG